jgi:hypothetical protein
MDHTPWGYHHDQVDSSIGPETRDHYSACGEDYLPVTQAYTHATQRQLSFYAGYYPVIQTVMFAKVEKIDDADFSSEESFDRAIDRFNASFKDVEAHDQDAFREGQRAREAVVDADAAAAQVPLPKASHADASARDVCPTGWRRYSCQFARLCLSPDLLDKSQEPDSLETRSEFVFAKCKADDRTASEVSTHASSYMVGYAAGFRLFDTRKYFKVVKVDSSYVQPDNVNWHARGLGAALERAGLSLLPPSAIQEYAHGWHDGNEEFQKFMAKVKQGAKESEGTQEQH